MPTRLWITMGIALVTVGFSRPAEASLFMSISDGAVTVTCTNPPDACGAAWSTPTLNIMVFTGTVGSYTVSTSSSATNNPGSAVIAQVAGWTITPFWAQAVVIDKYRFNESTSDLEFFGVFGTGPLHVLPVNLDLYWLDANNKTTTFNSTPGREHRHHCPYVDALLNSRSDPGAP